MSRTRAIAVATLLGVAAAMLTVNVAFAYDTRGFGGGFGRHHRDRGFMLLPLLLLIGVVVLLIVLWRNRQPAASLTAPAAPPTLNAQTILADRLARGEISPDDYRAAVAVLREIPPPA